VGTEDKRRPVLVLGREDVLPALSQVPVAPRDAALGPSDGLPGASHARSG